MPYKGAFFQYFNELLHIKTVFGQEWAFYEAGGIV
jgi:hypothetical protein